MTASRTILARARAFDQQGRLYEAINAYREILAKEPKNVDALQGMGLAVAKLGRFDDSCALLSAAVAVHPANFVAHANLGAVLVNLGRPAEAVAAFERAIALDPNLGAAHHGLGNALSLLGRHQDARYEFLQAVRCLPGNVQALTDLAVALQRLGQTAEALDCFGQAVEADPKNAVLHVNHAIMLLRLDRPLEAVAAFERAFALARGTVPGLLGHGKACLRLNRPEDALRSLDQAMALDPTEFEVHYHRGVALGNVGRLEESLQSFDRALQLNERSADAHNGRGVALGRLERHGQALQEFEWAAALDPALADALINAGDTLKSLGRYAEADANFDRALTLNPSDSKAAWSKSLLRLALGDFAGGWSLYESRFRVERLAAQRSIPGQKRWDGVESMRNKTLLVQAEQGLGDTVQFCRYVPLLEADDIEVVFEVQPALVGLMDSLGLRGTIVARGDPLPPVDRYIPLMSLPLVFGTTLLNIPARVPYLHPRDDRIRQWREQLGEIPGRKVGIVWQGGTNTESQPWLRGRSFPLQALEPLARLPDVRLVSLQKGFGSEQVAQVTFGSAISVLMDPAQSGSEELRDTAALICGLDLVITSDTLLAHLAAAVGAPVWIVLHSVPDWRWLLDRNDSPWYPNMRIFRRLADWDWDTTFKHVADELRAWLVAIP